MISYCRLFIFGAMSMFHNFELMVSNFALLCSVLLINLFVFKITIKINKYIDLHGRIEHEFVGMRYLDVPQINNH